jgi:hypothetical protein
MPIYMTDMDQTPDPRPGGGGGTESGGGLGSPPPAGQAWALTRRWVDVTWAFWEPEPGGSCTGFDVAVYTGAASLAGASAVLAVPVEAVEDPAARRHVALVELRSSVGLRAAVRVRYGAFRSAWADAALAADFVPDALPYGGESGCVRLPDGTVMQWLTSAPLSAQGAHALAWPAPFAAECHCASVTAVVGDGQTANDNWFQIVRRDAAGITLYKQSAGAASDALPVRAHVVAWGR